MATPLTSQECELLEAVASRDPGAWSVLGDYWIEHVDAERGAFVQISNGDNAERIDLADEEARLAAHAQRWRQLAIAAGYAERDLALAGGFLQWPIVVPAGHPLDGHPDIVRISPRYIRERGRIRQGVEFEIYEGEAITPRTRTPVVFKVPIYPELEYILVHEHEILARIPAHPNIARCLGWAVRTSGLALVFEWGGTDLRRLLRAAREHRIALGIDFALSLGIQLYAGIAAMHATDVINREVRTEHIAIAADGTVRILDFGVASRGDQQSAGRYVSPGVRQDMMYRVSYMSPEQALGRKLSPATDVYSAAVVLAELAAMAHPVPEQPNVMDLLIRIRDGGIEAAPSLPAPLRLALGLALTRDRRERPSASEMSATLIAAARTLKLDVDPHVIARRLVELGVPS